MHGKNTDQSVYKELHNPVLIYELSNHKDLLIFHHCYKPLTEEQFDHSKTEKKHPKKNNHRPQYSLIHILPLSCLFDQRP